MGFQRSVPRRGKNGLASPHGASASRALLTLLKVLLKRHVRARGRRRRKLFYARADGTEDVFELPDDVVIDKTTNQLRYEYRKNGKKTFDFDGILIVSPEFQITYMIGRTETSTGLTVVRESSIQIGAAFAKANLTGNLELSVKTQDGGSSTITIGGTFTAVLARDTKLAAGFRFEQVKTSGLVTSTTFAFAGELKIKNGATVTWTVSTTNTTTRTINLSVGTDIKLGAVSVDARLNITTASGQTQGVTFLLGVFLGRENRISGKRFSMWTRTFPHLCATASSAAWMICGVYFTLSPHSEHASWQRFHLGRDFC